jgi:hypothetical protein
MCHAAINSVCKGFGDIEVVMVRTVEQRWPYCLDRDREVDGGIPGKQRILEIIKMTLRETAPRGLDNILRAGNGALIVVTDPSKSPA